MTPQQKRKAPMRNTSAVPRTRQLQTAPVESRHQEQVNGAASPHTPHDPFPYHQPPTPHTDLPRTLLLRLRPHARSHFPLQTIHHIKSLLKLPCRLRKDRSLCIRLYSFDQLGKHGNQVKPRMWKVQLPMGMLRPRERVSVQRVRLGRA
jgi:hypothetical protein